MLKTLITQYGVINYEFRRTKKQKIIAKIDKVGNVFVYAPNYINISNVDEFLKSRAEWIILQSNKAKQEYLLLQNSELENIFIFGKNYSIEKVIADKASVKFENGVIFLYGPREQSFSLLRKKIEVFAIEYLKERFFTIKSNICADKDINVQVKNVKSWWGCYYPKKKLIKLSLRLITRDKECIDAVIFHEFAHIGEHNHKEGFYKKLLAIYPDYFAAKRKLKDRKYTITDNFLFGI